MDSDSCDDVTEKSGSPSSSVHSSGGDESLTQQSVNSEGEETMEVNQNEVDNFNYMDGEQMEIKDECDSKSDGSADAEENGTNNETIEEKSESRSRSISKEKENSESPQKNRSDRKRSRSHSRKESRSSSRGKSRSISQESRSHNRRSRSGGKRRSRSCSDRRSRSRSRRRSRSRSKRRRRHSRSRRSNSWSRRRRGNRRSRSRSRTPPDGARLHIAEIDVDTSKRDIERIFGKFGRMREVWMAHNPPCFAFVVFDRQKDADEAQRETNGTQLGRSRIRVTLARPRTRGGKFRGSYDPNMRCYQCGEIGHFSRNCTDTKFGYKRPPSPIGRRARRHSRSGSRSRSRSRRRSRS